MSNDEFIDVLDENGNVIGSMNRETAENDNHITENVLVFIFSDSGKVWVQLRPKNKKHYPSRWDISACGGILKGEKPVDAAERETLEETGLKIDLHHVESFLNVFPGDNGESRKRLSHLFIGVSRETPKNDSSEVDEFKDWQPERLREDVEKNPDLYIPSFIVELDKAVEGYRANFGK